jgi:WD repeat-containing protein 35
MLVYLSKKIALPSGVRLSCVSWSNAKGWLACGGENGLLKVLLVDRPKNGDGGNLSMNQTLTGHEGQ